MLKSWLLAGPVVMVLIVTAAGGQSHASSHASFSEEETRAIEDVVRSYLLENPEIIIEALRAFEARQRMAGEDAARQQISENRNALLDDPDSPVGGNPDGDVTIVEFFDYRCPYCKAVSPRLTQLLDEDRDIRFVYKEWPILGPVSETAARAALAAWKQGLYLEFHERLMAFAGELDEGGIFSTAADIGLDVDRLRRDMASAEIDEALQRNMALAESLGINGTPAFVIGDTLVPGAVELADLKALVQEVRDGS